MNQKVTEPCWEEREIDGHQGKKVVKVITESMTKAEARNVFPYRPKSKYAESRFGGNSFTDDVSLILSGLATRCQRCNAPTRDEYLKEGVCPDCDGRSEYNGTDPYIS